jgi:hypothetical protein
MLASGQSGIQLDLMPLQVADLGSRGGGIIAAMAVSLDGRWIAAEGYDAQADITYENFVCIFYAATGAFVARRPSQS